MLNKLSFNLASSLNESETEAYKIKSKVFTENSYLNENHINEEITVEEITRIHNAIENAIDEDEIQEIIYNISDGVLEDEVQRAFDQSIQDEDDLDSIESGMSSSNPFNLNFDKIEKKNFKEIPYDNNNIFMENDISFHHEKSNDYNENLLRRNDSQFFKFKFLDDNF